MAKKKTQHEEFEDAVGCFSFIVALIISVPYGIFAESFLGGVVAFLIVFFCVCIYFNSKEEQRINKIREQIRKSGIKEIDQMKGTSYEVYLSEMYKTFGYKVLGTKKSGDFGADLILNKDKRTIAVQVKRYKKNVGIRAIQEVTSAMSYYNADEGWVITNSYFTKSAKELALQSKIRLIDRNELISEIIQSKEAKEKDSSK
jgi:restriction system protein